MPELVVAGGTGQETALAVLRLCYLGGAPTPRIWVFDSDVAPAENVKGAAPSRAQVLSTIHEQLLRLGPLSGPVLHVVNPVNVPGRMTSVQYVADMFATHGQLGEEERLLLDLLVDSDRARITVNNGFHGEPALGSLTVAGATEQGSITQFEERLGAEAQTAAGLRVVFGGSVAGGTGTAVLPFLAQRIRQLSAGRPGTTSRLLAVLQVPWFHLKKVEGEPGSRDPDVEVAAFDRNASCLLDGYLRQVIEEQVDAVVLLGLPESVDRASHGGSRQLETKHYISLLNGITATNLLRDGATQAMLGQRWQGFHALTISSTPPEAVFNGPPAGPGLFLGARPLSLRDIIFLARGLHALTDALLRETESLSPDLGHHFITGDLLSKLPDVSARRTLRTELEAFHKLHGEILDWLGDCLRSSVGNNRADRLGAFAIPDSDFLDGTARTMVREAINAPRGLLGIERHLLAMIRQSPDLAAKADGKGVAWQLIDSGRRFLIDRKARVNRRMEE
jgi:hypothetical protein